VILHIIVELEFEIGKKFREALWREIRGIPNVFHVQRASRKSKSTSNKLSDKKESENQLHRPPLSSVDATLEKRLKDAVFFLKKHRDFSRDCLESEQCLD
jgi:hypothetical protein